MHSPTPTARFLCYSKGEGNTQVFKIDKLIQSHISQWRCLYKQRLLNSTYDSSGTTVTMT